MNLTGISKQTKNSSRGNHRICDKLLNKCLDYLLNEQKSGFLLTFKQARACDPELERGNTIAERA